MLKPTLFVGNNVPNNLKQRRNSSGFERKKIVFSNLFLNFITTHIFQDEHMTSNTTINLIFSLILFGISIMSVSSPFKCWLHPDSLRPIMIKRESWLDKSFSHKHPLFYIRHTQTHIKTEFSSYFSLNVNRQQSLSLYSIVYNSILLAGWLFAFISS